MTRPGVFHAGEAVLQVETGVRERMDALGPKIIRDFMPEQHRELFEKLPTMFVGVLDEHGQPWASIVHGAPGFVRAPDEHTLRLGSYPPAGDPALAQLRVGAPVGLLGLEPHTRRRNRANGWVSALEDGAWTVHVHQSFGNCPKYIHGREIARTVERTPEAPRPEGPSLSAEARSLVRGCDTLFLASSSARRLSTSDLATAAGAGVDVSHRGGVVGFVHLDEQPEGDVLTIPDYLGNFMFNTLGNLLVWPRAGVCIVDWDEGHVLQLAARAVVHTEGPRIAAFPGALRLLELRVSSGWLRPSAVPLAWTPPEAPPQFARSTGSSREG